MLVTGIGPRMRPLSLLVLCTVVMAGCGGGGGSGGGGNGGNGGDGNDGSTASNPRVAAVLDCLEGEGGEQGGAYELDPTTVALNTEINGVELHFLTSPARAKKVASDIEATGIGQVFTKGTVVEAWSSPPTSEEREPVTKCLEEDTGP